MGANKLHVGFPSMTLMKNCQKLVDLGFKVAIVEPTETSRQADDRLKRT